MTKIELLPKAIEWVELKSVSNLKSVLEGYDSPISYMNKESQEEITPDISYRNSAGAKYFTEIAMKDDDERALVTRWKLLSILASMKKGKLNLLAPKGHKSFVSKLVEKNNINAIVYSF